MAIIPAGMDSRNASIANQIGYGAGQVAGQVFRDLPSLLLLFFMTTVLGIAPDVAGVTIFVPKLLFGTIFDVSVGILSDRLRRKFARRWWLLAGAMLSPLAMILLFHVPEGSQTLKLAYVAGTFSLYMAVFASFSVPYLAMAGDLTSNPSQRNVVMAWRLVFTAVGVLVAGALAPAIIEMQGGGQSGYEDMALVLAAICPISLLIAFFSSAKTAKVAAASDRPALADRLSFKKACSILLAPRYSVLLLTNLLQLTGAGMAYASLLYFLTYNMGRADAFQLIGVVVIMACLGIVLAQPLWVRLADAIGKRRAYIAATILYLLTYVIWGFAASWGSIATFALSFVAAVGNSGWTMLGFSMMSDIASEDEEHAGLYSAAWIATDKIAFALGGTLLVGVTLAIFGFDSAKAVAGLPQSDSAMMGIIVAFAAIPVTLNIVGAFIFGRWGQVGDKEPAAA
ncbi:MFS transporter [Parasphingorhabdus sp.]|uniref:MFS transporter n=3 Tax=Parasphingorhabdus sp. TaxID=2709688 RepID=UPI0032667C88